MRASLAYAEQDGRTAIQKRPIGLFGSSVMRDEDPGDLSSASEA